MPLRQLLLQPRLLSPCSWPRISPWARWRMFLISSVAAPERRNKEGRSRAGRVVVKMRMWQAATEDEGESAKEPRRRAKSAAAEATRLIVWDAGALLCCASAAQMFSSCVPREKEKGETGKALLPLRNQKKVKERRGRGGRVFFFFSPSSLRELKSRELTFPKKK